MLSQRKTNSFFPLFQLDRKRITGCLAAASPRRPARRPAQEHVDAVGSAGEEQLASPFGIPSQRRHGTRCRTVIGAQFLDGLGRHWISRQFSPWPARLRETALEVQWVRRISPGGGASAASTSDATVRPPPRRWCVDRAERPSSPHSCCPCIELPNVARTDQKFFLLAKPGAVRGFAGKGEDRCNRRCSVEPVRSGGKMNSFSWPLTETIPRRPHPPRRGRTRRRCSFEPPYPKSVALAKLSADQPSSSRN